MLHAEHVGNFAVRQLPDRTGKMHDQHARDIASTANDGADTHLVDVFYFLHADSVQWRMNSH